MPAIPAAAADLALEPPIRPAGPIAAAGQDRAPVLYSFEVRLRGSEVARIAAARLAKYNSSLRRPIR